MGSNNYEAMLMVISCWVRLLVTEADPARGDDAGDPRRDPAGLRAAGARHVRRPRPSRLRPPDGLPESDQRPRRPPQRAAPGGPARAPGQAAPGRRRHRRLRRLLRTRHRDGHVAG